MGTISATEAGWEISSYKTAMQEMVSSIKKDFSDMDFENADKCSEMCSMVMDIERDSNSIQDLLDELRFEW